MLIPVSLYDYEGLSDVEAFSLTGKKLDEQRILFLGAGEAGTGIGKLIALAINQTCGVPMEEAMKFCFYVDSKGLVCKSRTGLQHHKLPFAHDVPFQPDLLSAVKELRWGLLSSNNDVSSLYSHCKESISIRLPSMCKASMDYLLKVA